MSWEATQLRKGVDKNILRGMLWPGQGRYRMAKKKSPVAPRTLAPAGQLPAASKKLLEDLRSLIRQTREGVAQAVNSALVLLYWEVGHRIRTETLKSRRAAYGEEILSTLSKELIAEFGNGFSPPNLSRMMRLAEVFPDREVVSTLSRQLSWSHFVEIIPLREALQRDFYAEMCRIERWSVRTLRDKIQGALYERTALSRKPEKLIRQELDVLRAEDRLTPDLVFRDPYFLDFLGLGDAYSEKDLESAILREMEAFILELGTDFAFLARQKRIVIDRKDYYIDLLFYHRRLRRLTAIDLKLGAFEAADKGQMELYLRWLEKHEMQPGEETPIGLILCADKGEEQIELLQLDQSGIRVASYLTDLPPQALLRKKLHDAIELAQARLQAAPPTSESKGSKKKRKK
jgi:predicted nuclease of restriction endonuclease-like (RecB) superfamily